MHKENIEASKSIMLRAKQNNKKLYFKNWQTFPPKLTIQFWREGYCKEERLHPCDSPCCFAGYIALSPEFQKDGGFVCEDKGAPSIHATEYLKQEGALSQVKHEVLHQGANAIAYWLDIPHKQACLLTASTVEEEAYPAAYRESRQPTFDEVIVALDSLLTTGLLPAEKV